MKDTFGFAAPVPLFGREGRMSDILERLQSQRTSLGTLWPEPNLHEEAAEKIIQLRKELDETKRAADAFVENEHLREEITRLREENARLREALKPFAEAFESDYAEQEEDHWDLWESAAASILTYGHLRAAASAILGTVKAEAACPELDEAP